MSLVQELLNAVRSPVGKFQIRRCLHAFALDYLFVGRKRGEAR